jgi:hypothetical protein
MKDDYDKVLYDRLSTASYSYKKRAALGVNIAKGLSDSDISKVWGIMQYAVKSGDYNYTSQEILSNLDFDKKAADSIVAIFVTLSDGITNDSSTEQIINAIVKADIAKDEDKDVLVKMLRLSPKIENIDTALRIGSIVQETMPSLAKIYTSIDVRFDFREKKSAAFSAVAIFNFHTDVENANLVFQASRERITELKKTIDKILVQMDKAESIVRSGVNRE